MNQSIFPKKELISFTNTSLVLYVEDNYNTGINTFIQSNFKQIVEYYTVKNIDFLYLPYLFQDKNYQAVVSYNRPYLKNEIDNYTIADIYNQIINRQTIPLKGAGLVLFETYYGNRDVVMSTTFDEDKALIEQFNNFASSIHEIFSYEDEIENSILPAYKRSLPKDSIGNQPQFMHFESKVEESNLKYDSGIRFRQISIQNADANFSDEAFCLAEEIRAKIQLLKESGSLSLIGDILEEIQGATKKLSKVFITNDYRIFLKDYNMQEVLMPPLPKSLFILFIRHPEGILFKQLSDYHDELLSIYRNVTVHENIERAMESIRAITDPLNNSINEKCSRIRAAFLEVIAEDLAQSYYVTGKRGEPKMINIDRSMVEFQ